ncbi:MAG TPA: hypothetical protein VJM08_02705 [Anaerolineales bacterium]|nr:hypothetical protein [Anaerolineales bacterium]
MARDSTALNWRVEPRFIIAVVALAAVGYYLLVSASIFRIGFPLDDSWIHLTYARNLAEHGEWAFRLGERSAGSTAPLWTVLLSIGFLLGLAPYIWTYFLGWVVLTLVGILAENIARKLIESYKPRLPWVGLFFVLAWHLTWSAVSGMETLLHGYIVLAVLGALMSGSRRYLTLGLLAGLSVWVRPDGLTLLGPILFTATLNESSWSSRGQAISKTLVGFGALFFLYLAFNLILSGNPMPNTFYAKQAEYETFWHSKPFTERVIQYLLPMIASPFLVLIPGAILWLAKNVREKNWGTIGGLIWFFGYIGIYFARLPAYQHGRYIIPAFPILYLWGVLGMMQFITSEKANKRIVFLWSVLTGILCLLFGFLAARQNAYDVYWIESEMVVTAQWVEQNVPPDALLAAHDIGALGYYVQNPILDLAGLITPEVVPFIRDEDRLVEYLNENSADYLIVFVSDYPKLTSERMPVFVAGLEYDPVGIENDMKVYKWK